MPHDRGPQSPSFSLVQYTAAHGWRRPRCTGHRAQLGRPDRVRQLQHLHEQPFDLQQKPLAGRGDGVVIGMLV